MQLITAHDVRQFLTHSMIRVTQHGFTHEAIAQTVEAWEHFCLLPADIKARFSLDLDEEGKPDTGWCRKQRTNGDLDNKEFYHYRLETEERFQRLYKGAVPFEVSMLNRACQVLHTTALDTIKPLVHALETEVPGITEVFYPNFPYYLPTLRLLRYYGTDDGMIAAPHADRCGITIQIAASMDGFWGGTITEWPNGDREAYRHLSKDAKRDWLNRFMQPIDRRHPEEIYLFAANKLETMSHGRIPSLYHKVVVPVANDASYVRWAIVFFHHPYHINHDVAFLH